MNISKSKTKNYFGVSKWKLLFAIVILPLSYFYYFYSALPFLNSGIDSGAVVYDSLAYMNFAEEFYGVTGLLYLATMNKNLVGPVFLTQLLGSNTLYIYIFNVFILYVGIKALFKSLKLKNISFVVALLINPMVFSSLVSINKEILSICAVMFMISHSQSERKLYFWIALALSMFSRFEMTAILLLYQFLRQFKSFRIRSYGVLLFVAAITIALPIMGGIGSSVLSDNQSSNSIGLSLLLNKIAMSYGFILILIPKILLNIFGDIREISVFSYTAISGLLFFISMALAWRKINISNDIGLLVILYSIAFAVPAFIHHRYYIPIYPAILALVFMRPSHANADSRSS